MEATEESEVVVRQVDSVGLFWKLSSLLSESSVAGAGVDVVHMRDEVRREGEDEEGCLMIVTQRRCGKLVCWSRSEDNLLRTLKDLKEKNERPLTAEEEQQFCELEPRFNAFVEQGMRAIDDTSVTTYIGWLPYSLLMSVNPGLLSKKGRRAVEMQSTLPIGDQADTSSLPLSWQPAFLLPISQVVGIRKVGGLLTTKGLRIISAPPPDSRAVRVVVPKSSFDCDATLHITKAVEGIPLKPGLTVATVDGVAADTVDLKHVLRSDSSTTVTLEVLDTAQHVLFTMGGGVHAFFKALEEHSMPFKKHPKDSTFLVHQ